MIQGDVFGAELAQEKPDAAILSHVLEHFHDPRRALSACHSALADRGVLYIEVPNILAPSSRKRLSNWLSPEHLYYFSQQTLSRLVTETGFDILRSDDSGPVKLLVRKGAPRTAKLGSNETPQVALALVRHQALYWGGKVVERVRRRLGA